MWDISILPCTSPCAWNTTSRVDSRHRLLDRKLYTSRSELSQSSSNSSVDLSRKSLNPHSNRPQLTNGMTAISSNSPSPEDGRIQLHDASRGTAPWHAASLPLDNSPA